MALLNTDITFYYSGGALNSNPAESYGGDISGTVITGGSVGNLLDHIFQYSKDVGATDGLVAGVKDYRVVYAKINPAATGSGTNGKLWLSNNTGIAAITYQLAVGALNTPITKPASENIAPSGVTLAAAPTTQPAGLALPDVVAGDYVGIVIERSIAITALIQDGQGPTIAVAWATL